MINLTSFSRPEHIGDIPFVPNTPQTLLTRNGTLPGDLFYAGLLLDFSVRLTVGVAPANFERADSPFSLINRIEVSGYHTIRKQNEVIYSRRGPDIYHTAQMYAGRAPGTTHTANLGVGAGAKDIRFFLPIWFVPERIAFPQQIGYLLDAPRYTNLVLRVFCGDGTSVLDPAGGTTFAFTPFNSAAAGNGVIRVHAIYAPFKSGNFAGFIPARVFKYDVAEDTGTLITTTANNVRLFSLPRGNGIRALMLKTGTKGATLTPGLDAYDTYVPATIAGVAEVINNIRLMQGTNKQIRQFVDFYTAEEYGNMVSRVNGPGGHMLLDFCEQGDIRTYLDTSKLVAGATGDTDLYLQGDVTATAAGGALLLVDEIRGVPVGLL